MNYTTDQIYALVGRDDKVAVITFFPNSDAYEIYGESLTAVFEYNQKDREDYERRFQDGIDEEKSGKVKLRYLGFDLAKDKIEMIKSTGINSSDIFSIFTLDSPHHNVFHKEEKRSMVTHNIQITKEPKGGDYDWMYGFKRRLASEGVEFFAHEKELYLAMKLFYEPEQLSLEEKSFAYIEGKLNEAIELQLLEIKFDKEVISKEEETRWEYLTRKQMESNYDVLKNELQNAGSSIFKISSENAALYNHLMTGIHKYIPRRLNGFKGKPIYLDWKGYLHVFIRHVDEFKINMAFENKDKFLWDPRDVIPVMKHVIEKVDDEIQLFWNEKPGQRFSKYGIQSFYYEGDYYTFHIEGDGRLSTFHRNRKEI